MPLRLVPILLVMGSSWLLAAAASSDAPDPQLAEGQKRYAEVCARCHGPTMDGIERAPALKGAEFRANWNGKMARELYKRIISTMPQDDPGSLPEQDVIAITSYVLSASDMHLPPVQKANDLNTIPMNLGTAVHN